MSTTTSTRGGTTVESLAKGLEKNYACNRSFGLPGTFLDDSLKVISGIDDILGELKEEDRVVDSFTIGKTYVRAVGRRVFDAANPTTWRKDGIKNRWLMYKGKDYDGLVVLTCVTGVPENASRNFNKEQYALALEQAACHHYALVLGDERLDNRSFSSGGSSEGSAAGYVVYLAFKFDNGTSE